MSSVGAYLRELRQHRGLSLEEIARTTRVAQRFLAALETEDFGALPAPVFTRGFIRAYCQALGTPPGDALAAYDARDGGAPQPLPVARPAPARRAETEPRTRGAVLVSFVLLVVLGMALFTVALVLHPRERAERVAEIRPEPRPVPPRADSEPAVSTPPGVATPVTGPLSPPAAAATTPAGPTAPAVAPAPVVPAVSAVTAPPTAPAGLEILGSVSSPYRLVARTNETTWIRVRTEDGRTSEENVPAGEVREWVSNRPFVLTIGNAGGVSFELNGRPLPPLGAKGAVIPRVVLPPESR
jgi:cytoskeleton protein RodZ